MKVEYRGTINRVPAEHHVLQVGDRIMDPIPGGGMDDWFDRGSAEVDNVMAIELYPLPE